MFFTGYTEQFANYMWHSDLILHPSSAEGVPRVLREALFIGKTIIASDLEGNRDLFDKYDSAILINSPSSDLYAELILSIKDNANLKLSYEKKQEWAMISCLASTFIKKI